MVKYAKEVAEAKAAKVGGRWGRGQGLWALPQGLRSTRSRSAGPAARAPGHGALAGAGRPCTQLQPDLHGLDTGQQRRGAMQAPPAARRHVGPQQRARGRLPAGAASARGPRAWPAVVHRGASSGARLEAAARRQRAPLPAPGGGLRAARISAGSGMARQHWLERSIQQPGREPLPPRVFMYAGAARSERICRRRLCLPAGPRVRPARALQEHARVRPRPARHGPGETGSDDAHAGSADAAVPTCCLPVPPSAPSPCPASVKLGRPSAVNSASVPPCCASLSSWLPLTLHAPAPAGLPPGQGQGLHAGGD